MTQKTDQILIINSLRGLAATAVCFYHFVYSTVDFIENETVRSIFYFGHKGVELFFIISGIVIPLSLINSNYSLRNWKNFMLKRFIRIEPPYLVAVAIGFTLLVLRNFVPGTVSADLIPSTKEVVLHLGYLIPFFENTRWINDVFWTLAIEFQYYLLLSLLFPLVLQKQLILRITFYMIFIGIGFLPVSIYFFPHWGPYFLVGIVYILRRTERIGSLEFGALVVLLIPIIYYLFGAIDLGIAFVAILVIHYFSSFKTKLTLFLGKISYSLYLLHAIIGASFVNYLSHHVSGGFQKALLVVAGFLISLGSAYLLYRFVEKPSHNWAKKIR